MIQLFFKATIAIIFLFSSQIYGNNLHISNVSLASINTSNQTIMIKFDISWENSWRTSAAPNNWDAVWTFVKYRVNNGAWIHATLSTVEDEHLASAGSIIDPSSDGKGVFIYRSDDGTGSNLWTNTQICWKYSVDGVSDLETNVEVRVIGIEVVYIPEGPFFAGDNATSIASFRQGSEDNDPWYIGSENDLNVTNSVGSGTGIGATNLEYYIVGNNHIGEDTTGSEFLLPALFPKGYNAFYCMKYEISQGQYTDFLNMLTREQQSARVATDITTDVITNIYVMSNTATLDSHNGISCPATGNGTTDPILFSVSSPDIACNYLGWADGVAFSDWAGLRPMTELEFEKTCRGPLPSVSGEFPWGTTNVANGLYTITDIDAMNESVGAGYSTTSGNASYRFTCSIDGPMRVGLFAGNIYNNGRITSGAAYYGVMELGGNLRERIVSVGNPVGRTYTGISGNGVLTQSGDADVENWPDITAVGSGFKGGSWDYEAYQMCFSDRSRAGVGGTGRSNSRTFRAVRFP